MHEQNGKTRVLVIEDSPTQALQLKHILSGAGFVVEVAHDGADGLDKFALGDYDIVLSDVMMPGIDGYQVTKKIKATAKGRQVPVVLLTVLSELKDLIEGLRNGADNFLTKPYEPSFLIARIRNVLDNKKEDAPAQSVCDPDSGMCFIDTSFLTSLDKKRILDYLVSTFDDFLVTRQREAESKMAEATQRMQLVKVGEKLVRDLVRDIDKPLTDLDAKLMRLAGGEFGELNSAQETAVAEIRSSLTSKLVTLRSLLEEYGLATRPGEGVQLPPKFQTMK